MTAVGRHRQRGFLLIGVVLVLGVLAAISLALSSSTSLELSRASRQSDDAMLDYLAESGIEHAAWRLANDDSCKDYGSTPATTLGGGSYQATVSPGSGSPVTLSSVATLNAEGRLDDGLQRTSVRDGVTVYSSATQKLVLQPDQNGFDTFLWDGLNEVNNFGASAVLEIKNIMAGRIILIRFDLSAIPEGAVLTGATLQLYLERSPDLDLGAIDLHAMNTAWIEGDEDGGTPDPVGATYLSYDGTNDWIMPGGDYVPTIVDSVTMLGRGAGWVQWDVSPLVAGGATSTLATYGVILRGTNGDLEGVTFTSSDGTAERRPKLSLSIRCECGSPCSAVADADTLTFSTRNDAQLGGLAFQYNDAVAFDSATDSASVLLDGGALGHTVGIDALHVLANGHVILSTDDDAKIGGLTFTKEDLIDYDPVADTAALLLEATAHFVDPRNIDAVHVLDDGDIVLSTDADGALGGVAFSALDLVRYNPDSGVASVYFDGDATTLSETITGVHVLEDGMLALTADAATTLGGLAFGADQVIIYDRVGDKAVILFDGPSQFTVAADIASLHVGLALGAIAGPVAHWRLDEASGSTAIDSVGGHDATLSGSTARTTGKDGGAVSFDGGSATAAIPDDAVWDLTPTMLRTWMMWVKPDDLSTSWQSLWAQTSSTPRGFGIFAHSTTDASMGPVSNGISVGWDESGSDKLGVHSFDDVLTAGAWHHVAVTYDGAQPQADRVRIYVDGADATDTGDVSSIGTLSGLDPTSTAFGGNPVDLPSWYDGDLDDVRVYDRVLGASAVAAVMTETGGGGGGPGAIEYRDEFNAPDTFDGSEGALTWSTPWLETPESDGPQNGDLFIAADATPYQLRIGNKDRIIEREADLSACSGAQLSFDYRRAELGRANRTVSVQVSDDGGTSWASLDIFAGPVSETVYEIGTYDISGFVAVDTRIRFVTSTKLRNTDEIFVDNVQIDCP